MLLRMSFLNKLNVTYELLDKLDDIINKKSDNGVLKKQLLSVSDDLSRYKNVDTKNIRFEDKKVKSKITDILNNINDIEINVKNKLIITEKYNTYLNS